ncbi:MAG: chitobiase/beta-hexosaminidase C-terminal domain-containing protein, partial [Verrucomicrobiae bacterium]|nr:chitobiase/beta-hexosaminidase C-terminal domain-containing protein [Verrucomicrobiae bacterium]
MLTEIAITFSEPVSGVDADDLLINAIAPVSVSGSEAGPYVFTFTQPLSGTVSVSFDFDHGISEIDGSAFAPLDGWSYQLVDTIAPAVGTILSSDQDQPSIEPAPLASVATLTQTLVTFSEPVTGVDAADLLVNGTPAGAVTGNEAGPYTFTFPQPTAGTAAFTWSPSTGIMDAAGNAFASAGANWSVALTGDTRPPLQITEFSAANATGPQDEDKDSPDWIEIYNPGPGTVNLSGWSLSKDPLRPAMWQFPAVDLAADTYLLIFASGKDRKSDNASLHTNFSLDLRGGYLALFGPESPRTAVYEYVDYPEQPYDVSYGLTSAGDLRFFSEPTAGEANPEEGLINVSPQPTFSVSRGFFAEPFSLVISAADPDATIRYTLNGSEPTEESPAYSTPLAIDKTSILRAATFAANSIRSRTVTQSYIYLDQVLNQPEPPYDNPDKDDDNDNPPLPTVGDYTFPIDWGTQSGAGFPGLIRNIPTNRAPADYGMDREIIDDPAKYNDNGEIDEVNGITNLERITKSFRELPLMSVVIDNDLMFSTRGLHWNSTVKGPRYEAPCSVELLLPDGTTGFETTCGIRLHGNASREPRKCPKHGFKLNFKGEFGAAQLEAPLFPDSPATEFDDIILRGDFNSSWLHWDGGTQRPRGTRLRDAYSKDTFRDMGRAAGHHRYVHLFINGIYWGTYDATEQENSGFAANTFGGEREDYDVYEQGGLKSGTSTVYRAMSRIRQPIDNTDYELMKTMLDVPWLADYMILHFYLGHQDWGGDINKNWYAVRHKDGGFRYLPWDMENLMWSETQNSTTVSSPPTGLHTNLDSNDQYLLDFGDRVHKHMVAPDGALRPESMTRRWGKWRAVMQNAIAAESARWGDYRRDVHRHSSGPYPLFTWNESWITENNRLTKEYFPVRTDIVLDQMRRRNLYPELNAPEFRDSGNTVVGSQRVSPGFQFTMTLPDPAPARSRSAGTIYYTTDGSDPRVYFDTTGQRTGSATEYTGAISVGETTTVKARALDGTDWSALMEATFTVGSELPQIRFSEIHYNPP